jgi:hypothetical protein
MKANDEILLTILAKTDAAFWPIRNHDCPGRVLFYERRWGFLTAGLPWASGAASDAGRKAAQRDLEKLAAPGKVLTYKPRGVRTLGVRLSEKADDAMRRMIGLATYADALPLLDELHRRLTDGDGCDEGGRPWTSEQSLTGVKWGDNERRGYYVLLTEDAYPLLWRGLVESNASMQGHVWYGLTAAGLALAQERDRAGAAQEWPPSEPADGEEGASDFYLATRRAEIAAIEAGSPEDKNEIGGIPMPVCPSLRKCQGCAAPCADGPEYKCPKDAAEVSAD